MNQKMKSFKVFTGLGYRILLFAVLPLVLLGLQLFISVVFQGTGIPLFAATLVIVEIMADNWFLGGIQEKNAIKIDYLKTSVRGMKVMKNVLIMDVARRFLSCAGILGLCQAIAQAAAQAAARGISVSDERRIAFLPLCMTLFTVYFLSALGVFIARFFSYLWVNLLCGYIGWITGLIACLTWISLPLPGLMAAGILCGLVVLSVGISVLMVKIAMMKVEGSYYDK